MLALDGSYHDAMSNAEDHGKPQLSFWWDWGCGPFWCANDQARAMFDVGPIDPEALGLPDALAVELEQMIEWHDTSLNWEYPPDPGPWRQEEYDRFNAASMRLFETCRNILWDSVELVYTHPEERQDPDLDRYLDDPRQFKRADAPDPGGATVNRFEPHLTAPLPAGWFAKESLTLLSPDGQANLIVSSEPLDPSVDTTQYAAVQGDLLAREFPGYHQLAFEPARMLGSRQGYIRRFEWRPPDGLPVTQLQQYYVESGRGYTATATVPSTLFERFEDQFLELLGGIRIDLG